MLLWVSSVSRVYEWSSQQCMHLFLIASIFMPFAILFVLFFISFAHTQTRTHFFSYLENNKTVVYFSTLFLAVVVCSGCVERTNFENSSKNSVHSMSTSTIDIVQLYNNDF